MIRRRELVQTAALGLAGFAPLASRSASSSFGIPVHLLCDTADEARPEKLHDDIFMMSASSHFKTTTDEAGPSRPSIYPIQGASSSSDWSVKGLGEENDWAMGDDEMALVDPEPDDNDEEEMKEIEIESSPPGALSSLQENGITTCPICALHLVGLFVSVRFLLPSLLYLELTVLLNRRRSKITLINA